MTFAVLRIRSPRKKKGTIENVLKHIGLNKVNHCKVVNDEEQIIPVLKKVKDIVTWGELNGETLEKMLRYRSSMKGELTDDMIDEKTDYKTVSEFAEAIVDGNTDVSDFDGLNSVFRLHPPRGGYKGVKKPYNTGGSLGYRGKEINSLLSRMFGPDVHEVKDE